jgi:hypothetical protein
LAKGRQRGKLKREEDRGRERKEEKERRREGATGRDRKLADMCAWDNLQDSKARNALDYIEKSPKHTVFLGYRFQSDLKS